MIFSPYSISTILALTLAGAKQQTRKQMLDVLSIDHEINIHASHGMASDQLLTVQGQGIVMSIANNMYVQGGYHVNEHFLDIARKYYKAKPQELDFSNEPVAR